MWMDLWGEQMMYTLMIKHEVTIEAYSKNEAVREIRSRYGMADIISIKQR